MHLYHLLGQDHLKRTRFRPSDEDRLMIAMAGFGLLVTIASLAGAFGMVVHLLGEVGVVGW